MVTAPLRFPGKPAWLACVLIHSALSAAEPLPRWQRWDVTEPWGVNRLCAAGDTLWAIGEGGVRRSTDNGVHWSEPKGGMGPEYQGSLLHGRHNLIATQFRTLFVSEDGGSNWTARDSADVGSYFRLSRRGDTLFAEYSLYENHASGWVRLSMDDGLSWREAAAGEAVPPLESGPVPYGADTYRVSGRDVIGSAGDTVLSLTNGVAQLIATPRSLIALSTEGTCFGSDDGRGGWKQIVPGYAPAEIRYLALDSLRMAMYTERGIYLSRDRGASWELAGPNPYPIGKERNLYQPKLFLSKETLFLWHWRHAGIWRYRLATGTWDSVPMPQANDRVSAWLNNLLTIGNGLIYNVVGNTLYVSSDQGETYRSLASPPNYASVTPTALWMHRNRLHLGYWGTEWVTADTGRTWTAINTRCLGLNIQGRVSTGAAEYPWDESRVYRQSLPDSCLIDEWPGPEAGQYTVHSLAARGSTLYLVTDKGAWTWEEPGITPVARRLRLPQAARPAQRRFPARAWRMPGAETWIDAKGATLPAPRVP